MNLNPLKKSTSEDMKQKEGMYDNVLPTAQDNIKSLMQEEFLNAIAEKTAVRMSAERSETHEYREEVIPPVITIGTDLDKEDPITNDIKTKEDKWGFWIEYQGTKGMIFDTEVPKFQFSHLGTILPNLRNHIYKYTYEIDKNTGCIVRDESGKPKIIKKERVFLIRDLSNLKARLNLAEKGYARNQQKDVIIGGVGQVDPYTGDRMREIAEFAFGKARK